MATAERLIAELNSRSHTYGWGAVAAFDGSVVMPMLADYYAPMIHGQRGVAPISGELSPFVDLNVVCALGKLVLGAPRFSLGGDLQNSILILTYDFLTGSYYERSDVAGTTSRVSQYINIGMGRAFNLSIQIDLSECRAVVTNGVAQLRMGPGRSPVCNLGSEPFIQGKVAEYLLEVLNQRYANAGPLPLGIIDTDRAYLRPAGFKLRAHAKPGGSDNEFALIAFIAGADGVEGSYPNQSDLPYLIPDDIEDGMKAYAATVLVSQAYAMLGTEVSEFIGQVLFPNANCFQSILQPANTRDVVQIGKLQAPQTPARIEKKSRRSQPGVTSMLQTRTAGDRREITLLASTLIRDNWEWELASPGVGELRFTGAEATYVPPASLPVDTDVVVQRIIASNQVTRDRYEVCVVLSTGTELNAFETPMLMGVPPNGPQPLELIYGQKPPIQTAFSVLGQGTVQGKTYYPPTSFEGDIEVVIARFYRIFDGDELDLGWGYCIIQLIAPTEEAGWISLTDFTLEGSAVNARPFANGLQQFAIRVNVETKSGGPGLSEEEWASLRLVFRGEGEVERIAHTVERLMPGADGAVNKWGWTDKPNGFNPATLPGMLEHEVKERANGRYKTLYLQTTDVLPANFVARFTDRFGAVYTSDDSGGSESSKHVLTVTPRPVPAPTSDHYSLTIRRAHGKYDDGTDNPMWTETNPNYDWNPITTDYWNLVYKFENYAVPFVRLLWDKNGPGAMWETKQNDEEAFSFIGYMVVDKPVPNPAYFKFSSKLYDPALKLIDPETHDLPDALLKFGWEGDGGSLLFSLHRVLGILWSRRALVAGFDLEDPFTFTAWDKNGTQHRLTVGFTSGRHKLFVN
jgi:hypothetical protein